MLSLPPSGREYVDEEDKHPLERHGELELNLNTEEKAQGYFCGYLYYLASLILEKSLRLPRTTLHK